MAKAKRLRHKLLGRLYQSRCRFRSRPRRFRYRFRRRLLRLYQSRLRLLLRRVCSGLLWYCSTGLHVVSRQARGQADKFRSAWGRLYIVAGLHVVLVSRQARGQAGKFRSAWGRLYIVAGLHVVLISRQARGQADKFRSAWGRLYIVAGLHVVLVSRQARGQADKFRSAWGRLYIVAGLHVVLVSRQARGQADQFRSAWSRLYIVAGLLGVSRQAWGQADKFRSAWSRLYIVAGLLGVSRQAWGQADQFRSAWSRLYIVAGLLGVSRQAWGQADKFRSAWSRLYIVAGLLGGPAQRSFFRQVSSPAGCKVPFLLGKKVSAGPIGTGRRSEAALTGQGLTLEALLGRIQSLKASRAAQSTDSVLRELTAYCGRREGAFSADWAMSLVETLVVTARRERHQRRMSSSPPRRPPPFYAGGRQGGKRHAPDQSIGRGNKPIRSPSKETKIPTPAWELLYPFDPLGALEKRNADILWVDWRGATPAPVGPTPSVEEVASFRQEEHARDQFQLRQSEISDGEPTTLSAAEKQVARGVRNKDFYEKLNKSMEEYAKESPGIHPMLHMRKAILGATKEKPMPYREGKYTFVDTSLYKGNGRPAGEVLNSVLTTGEGPALKDVCQGIVARYTNAKEPPPLKTSDDNTGTTDPTPTETTGYSNGETESLDDSTPGFSLLTDVRLSLSPSPTVTEPTNPPSTSTPTPSSPSALLPVPKKRRLAASPRKPAPGLKL
ncbi:hypothetical protein Bbelb_049810 [Branchiostoma belcheri]|nr:hypothetical protein Bbelb_049810 [Branchiostoma belcheri]